MVADVDWVRMRKAVGAFLVDGFFMTGSRLAKLHPRAKPERHGVEVLRNVSYGPGGREHLLDVYRPKQRSGSLPVVLYVHGGGFRILSKDSHWLMALAFARAGYVVFNINYRLAPRHPYPAAIEDCADAYAWVIDNAATFGGDVSRLALAGESAGANLVTAMTIAATYERTEAYAQRIFATRVVPRATLPACGLLQVTDVERLARRRHLPAFIVDRLVEVTENYLPVEVAGSSLDMADPVCVLERREPPARPLPPFFIPCGTKDPILDDTRRLGRAVAALGARADVKIYPGEMHAFHALMWRAHAKQCWADTHAFLKDVLK
ncbi:MAG: alpha/beta hydrolase [Polyangiaceae bacterium]|jgi:acetyl esterase|nr:alpha/beta hydrolase [Polyangiaceae bacterium]MBK8937363.1 alpha/beta hydrolase [Polyangiaceae bacterium]